MRKLILTNFLLITFYQAFTQTTNNVGIGTLTPNANAILDITSTTKGFLGPRMSTAEKNTLGTNLSTTDEGMFVYDTDTQSFWYWDGNSWIEAIGPMGPTGADGKDGVDGVDGADGKDGVDGVDGQDGAQGSAGPAGATGATGATGADGSSNAWGLTGNAGTTAGTNFLGTTDSKDLVIKTNGSEVFRITSAGNIGMGTTSPSAFLFVDAPSNTSALRVRTSSTTRLLVNSDGNIGIGTTSPAYKFHYNNSSSLGGTWNAYWENSASSDGTIFLYNSDNSNTSSCLKGVTTYNGNSSSIQTAPAVWGLASGSSGSKAVGVKGEAWSDDATGVYGEYPGGGTGWALYSDGYAGGTTSWYNVSDKRLKKEISTIGGALDKVKMLRGVKYKFDNTNYPDVNMDTESEQIGFIAQEIESVFPEMVREGNLYGSNYRSDIKSLSDQQNTYKVKTVSYSTLIPVLVEAIKEQQKTIESLESRIAELEKQK
jgi:hypothetical protein